MYIFIILIIFNNVVDVCIINIYNMHYTNTLYEYIFSGLYYLSM